MADDRVVSVRLRALTDSYEAAMRRAGAATRSLRDNADRDIKALGDTMRNAGRSMTMGLTLPIAAGVAFAVRESINFESAMAGVAKTIDLTDDEFAAMSQGIRDMAKELPASREEIAAVAEAAGQLGIAKENVLSFTRTMIDLGESTNLTADQAATALAQFANITQMPQGEFDRLGSTIVALGNAGASTEADIVDLGQRLAGAGDQAGLTEAEIMGLASAMADVGINAEMGGTSMSMVLSRMRDAAIEGGPHLEAFAEAAGMTAEQFARLFDADPAAAITAFVQGLGRITEEGGTVTPVMEGIGLTGERVRDTLNRLAGAGDGVAGSFDRANAAWEENTALTEEAARRYETTGAQMEIAWNRITDAAMSAGDVLAPIIASIAEEVASLAEIFGRLPGPVQSAMVGLALLAAAAGPLVWIGGRLVAVWATFGSVMPQAAQAVRFFVQNLGALVRGVMATNPVLAGLAIAATAVAAALAFDEPVQFDMVDELNEIASGLMEMARATGDAEAALGQFLAQRIPPELAQGLLDAGATIEDVHAALVAGGPAFGDLLDRLGGQGVDTEWLERVGVAFLSLQDDMGALDAVGAFDPITEEAGAAEQAIEDLETAWADLNNLLSDTEAAINARQALRDLREAAFGALEGGIDAGEMDDLRLGVLGYAGALQTAAEAANTTADGVVDAAGAQRTLRRSMREVRDEIPQQLLPMWDRMIRELGRPARLNADGSQARGEVNRTAGHAETRYGRKRYVATLDANEAAARAAHDRAIRLGEDWEGRVYTAHFDARMAGGIPGQPRAAGGPVEAGRPYIVGEHRPELFVPDVDGRIVPSVPAMADGRLLPSATAMVPAARPGGGGVTVTVPVTVNAPGFLGDESVLGAALVREIERGPAARVIARAVGEALR